MDEKLERILTECFRLFKKYGLKSISMDDIARELGISKKTLYQYVSNKTELIEQMLNHMVEKGNYESLREGFATMNAIDILLEVSKKVSAEIKDLNPSNMFDLQKFYPTLYHDFVIKKRDLIFRQIKENFERGISEGLYRNDLDTELVARLYIKKLIDMHDPDFLSSVDFSVEKVFSVMFDNHIRGIANLVGLTYYEKQISI